MALEQWRLPDAFDPDDIDYPGSDGEPMAETPPHWRAMVTTTLGLEGFFAHDPMVYVGSNMLFYDQRGNPHSRFSPDVFVTFGTPRDRPRRVYKLWEEPVPSFILELTSAQTRVEDQGPKRLRYAALRVRELVLFDVLGDYLDPPLQGYELFEDEYVPREMAPLPDGTLRWRSKVLGLELHARGEQLRLWNPRTGEYLPTPEEEVERRRRAEQRVEEELRRRLAAEQRAAALEQELAKLRAELERRQGG